MAILSHILGFPRIGLYRELKKAQESYWKKEISYNNLLSIGRLLRERHWLQQKKSGLDFVSVGDFSWYDHVLNTSMMLGNIPDRHKTDENLSLDTLFNVARGFNINGNSIAASDMTKWFNTNYHYIVPEFFQGQKFSLIWMQLFDEIKEAVSLGYKPKPILLGPITYLWLGKIKGKNFNKLDLLESILPVYKKILIRLKNLGIEWIQIDEPVLVLELSVEWKNAFNKAYEYLYGNLQLLLTTYFDSVIHNLDQISNLPVQGIHVDLVYGKYNLFDFNSIIPKNWIISLGVINGRNIWKSNLMKWFKLIKTIIPFRENIWIGSSCSLLHVPIDVTIENQLDKEVKSRLSFAVQKCKEICLLTEALNTGSINDIKRWTDVFYININCNKKNELKLENKIKSITEKDLKRNSPYILRSKIQNLRLNLPILPTTTIGSFPQTKDIRKLRLDFKNKVITFNKYEKELYRYIKEIIIEQEKLQLDVLVHGEPERNDMVEYFGEQLEGFVFTANGWVQSYGSRCVKPPIIIGDVVRKNQMTVKWSKYAQSLTKKLVKGMLTGPITMLFWSFFREDILPETIAKQIALSLREEVLDLEKSGIKIIQIDEPALREGLPLRKSNWKKYLFWAINAFRLSSSGVKDETQIHTHMCYCEFNDIMPSIVELDADVITIETSRSDMELLEFFKSFNYPNSIGPGVYDIHSQNIPTVDWIVRLLKKALITIPRNRLWVNPDCGLKTRNWDETKKSLINMVKAAKSIRIEEN